MVRQAWERSNGAIELQQQGTASEAVTKCGRYTDSALGHALFDDEQRSVPGAWSQVAKQCRRWPTSRSRPPWMHFSRCGTGSDEISCVCMNNLRLIHETNLGDAYTSKHAQRQYTSGSSPLTSDVHSAEDTAANHDCRLLSCVAFDVFFVITKSLKDYVPFKTTSTTKTTGIKHMWPQMPKAAASSLLKTPLVV
jgi:hypothetical protein